MKSLVVVATIFGVVACAAQPTTAISPTARISRPSANGGADSSAEDQKSVGGSTTGSGTSTTPVTTVKPYTLAEAKVFCVECHASGASASVAWGKADGTEADWKTDAEKLRAAVMNNMPMGKSSIDKQRFYAFLDQLIGKSGGTSTTGSTTTGSTTLTAAQVFDLAQKQCTGCHSGSNAPDGFTLSKTDAADWVSKKTRVISAVNSLSKPMPPSGFADATQKQAFIDFVNSLK